MSAPRRGAGPAPDRRHGAPDAPRRLALAVLEDISARGRRLDESLAARLGGARLEPRDRAFVRNLATTTLRRLGQIDALLAAYVTRPLPISAHTALNILRLGAAQLVFLDMPAHAAVNETVALAEAAPRHRGLINAVMRRLAAEGKAKAELQDAPKLNTPEWLWRAWAASYGEATARHIAEAHLVEPPLDLTAAADAAAWAARLEAELLPTGSLRRHAGGVIAELAGYQEGAWWVQDAAAALPARLCGDVRGRRVVDLCAAPGGKSAQLAAAGAEVTAVDLAPPRLERLRENLARLRLSARLVAADAANWQPETKADAVLLDAPCSATGTIRRHPDLPWRKQAKDLANLAAAQDRLLANAAAMVAPGGLLVYAVCSLEPAEGPKRIARFLARHPDFALDRIDPAEIGGCAAFVAADGTIRTLPCHWAERGGIDGFYAARLRKAGASGEGR